MAEKRRQWRGPRGMNLADIIVLIISGALILYLVVTAFNDDRPIRRPADRPAAARPKS